MGKGRLIPSPAGFKMTRTTQSHIHPLTDEEKLALLQQAGLVTGENLAGQLGPRYRSNGTHTNVWEKDLFALIDAATEAERERCAKVCEELTQGYDMSGNKYKVLKNYSPSLCADAIRNPPHHIPCQRTQETKPPTRWLFLWTDP